MQLPLFGECCASAAWGDLQRSQDATGNTISEKTNVFAVMTGAGLATVAELGEHRVYFQGTDMVIRQAIYEEYSSVWCCMETPDDIGVVAKADSPLAATEIYRGYNLAKRSIRIFCLNDKNQIQERIWEPLHEPHDNGDKPPQEWRDGPLCNASFETLSSSKLAVTSWGDGRILLCYQATDGKLRLLYGRASQWKWMHARTLVFEHAPAVEGSSLALLNFRMGFRRGFRLYYQSEDMAFREACFDSVDDITWDDHSTTKDVVKPPLGGFHVQSVAGASIVAHAYREEGDLNLRLYVGGDGKVEVWRYKDYWIPGNRTVLDAADVRAFAVGRRDSRKIASSLYFVSNGSLEERPPYELDDDDE